MMHLHICLFSFSVMSKALKYIILCLLGLFTFRLKVLIVMIFMVVLAVLVLASLTGNTLVILTVFTNKPLQSTLNYLLVNLAVADMFFVVITGLRFVVMPWISHPDGSVGNFLLHIYHRWTNSICWWCCVCIVLDEHIDRALFCNHLPASSAWTTYEKAAENFHRSYLVPRHTDKHSGILGSRQILRLRFATM